jgi:hypothetical protein
MKVNKPLIGLLTASLLALGVLYLASKEEEEDEEEENDDDYEGDEIDIDAMSEALQENDGKDPLVMPEHASALCQAAAAHRAKGEGNEAASCYLRALKILESSLGPAHPHNATVKKATSVWLMDEKSKSSKRAANTRQHREASIATGTFFLYLFVRSFCFVHYPPYYS